jgi:hypothetical protein
MIPSSALVIRTSAPLPLPSRNNQCCNHHKHSINSKQGSIQVWPG